MPCSNCPNWFLENMEISAVPHYNAKMELVKVIYVARCKFCRYSIETSSDFDARRTVIAHILTAHRAEYLEHSYDRIGHRNSKIEE